MSLAELAPFVEVEGLEVAAVLDYDLGMAHVEECERALDSADIDRLPESVEHQHVFVQGVPHGQFPEGVLLVECKTNIRRWLRQRDNSQRNSFWLRGKGRAKQLPDVENQTKRRTPRHSRSRVHFTTDRPAVGASLPPQQDVR